tara:strand:+ start:84 stop:893 length:810 start_codon:yes stop_codon:yes gene_type:complete
MSFKSFLQVSRNLFFASVGLSVLSLINSNPAKANNYPACPAEGSAAASGAQTQTCTTTPTVMEIKFYELGFCTSDPLSGADFDNSTCQKAWESALGQTADLAGFNYLGLTSGTPFKIPSKQYDYAYVVFDPTWGLKGKVYFNDTTYYTNASGNVTETLGDYDKFELTINALSDGACQNYSANTDYGAVKARLANNSLTSATDNTSCNSATRMVGSVDLNTPIVMTDDVKAYQLTWIIRDMGIESTDNGGSNAPLTWKGGPFVPNFTLLK